MYRSSPFRSTLNTGYITCLGMCKVCTEAVHSVALCPAKTTQTPKHGPGKKDRNRAMGVFQGRRTSRSAGIYIYIYQSIEAWGTWSILEVSTSSTGSRMDPHNFIVCMRKVRETELEAATVCPAAVSNKS